MMKLLTVSMLVAVAAAKDCNCDATDAKSTLDHLKHALGQKAGLIAKWDGVRVGFARPALSYDVGVCGVCVCVFVCSSAGVVGYGLPARTHGLCRGTSRPEPGCRARRLRGCGRRVSQGLAGRDCAGMGRERATACPFKRRPWVVAPAAPIEPDAAARGEYAFRALWRMKARTPTPGFIARHRVMWSAEDSRLATVAAVP